MAKAYVLINAEMGSEADVINSLKELQEVSEVYAVNGAYNVLCCLQTESMEQIKTTLSWKIRRLDKVKSTRTAIVI